MAPKNIWIAASEGNLQRVMELIETDHVSVNAQDENGYSPLHAAISYNYYDLADYLLKNGADPNIMDTDRDTPLFVCETVGCARLLVDRGAQVNHRNDEQQAAYEVAAEEEHLEVANFLRQLVNLPALPETTTEVGEEDDPNDYRVEIPLPNSAAESSTMADLMQNSEVPNDSQLRAVATQMVLDSLNKGNNIS
ncbi:hypothetical protein IWQ62_003515 [Dispira parvispora]|uniref:Ankyrin n=1 Tax=Dispira parvispora TaxID=1520584 RepID=A0A9W8AUP2_9FUNG|nr:hypothetical protein IWQ62_003515 [Dispira parvispora]